MKPFNKIKYKLSPKKNLADVLPWVFIGAPGVVFQKDALFQKTYAFRGPDLDAASPAATASLSWQFNDAIKRLGNCWSVFFELQRFKTSIYPYIEGVDSLASRCFEIERREHFRNSGNYFDCSYFVTFVWQPPADALRKSKKVFYSEQNNETSVIDDLKTFTETCDDIMGILGTKMDVYPLDDSDTLSYLHTSISNSWHRIMSPNRPMFIDSLIEDECLVLGNPLVLGNEYIGILSVRDFPSETHPGILDKLNRIRLEYRWMTRFICQDKEESVKDIDKKIAKYYGGRKNWKQYTQEAMNKESSGRINQGQMALEEDATQALIEVTRDDFNYGRYCSCIMVRDSDIKTLREKLALVRTTIQSAGFVAKEETFNAYQSFLSMMPGNVYPNRRVYSLNTGNLSHIIPLTSVWKGDMENKHLQTITRHAEPLMICKTRNGGQFYLNLNVGDVGHTFISGPTGAGKSTIAGAILLSALKYPANVVIFDKDRSARKLTMAVGGSYYEPGAGDLCFQPLSELNTQEDIIFACEFIELLLSLQLIPITAAISKAINETIMNMVSMTNDMKTISGFAGIVQYEDPISKTNVIRDALHIYTKDGTYGSLFDAEYTNIKFSKWMMFEMEPLMKLGEKAILPSIKYLFYLLEKTFTGTFTILFIDEAWKFLQHPQFESQMQNWLKTLRKKNVFVVFATQEISDAAKSNIMTTILQQCHTKIYLPDEEAISPGLLETYRLFGLTDAEISLIASAEKKRDYFYKSSQGVRLFELSLGKVGLALLTGTDHQFLDELEKQNLTPTEITDQIFKKAGIEKHINALLTLDGFYDSQKETYIAKTGGMR